MDNLNTATTFVSSLVTHHLACKHFKLFFIKDHHINCASITWTRRSVFNIVSIGIFSSWIKKQRNTLRWVESTLLIMLWYQALIMKESWWCSLFLNDFSIYGRFLPNYLNKKDICNYCKFFPHIPPQYELSKIHLLFINTLLAIISSFPGM